jgi:hypothetical protein
VSDVTARLRLMMTPDGMQSPLGVEAAAEIVRLRAEVEQLESAWTFINIWKGRYESQRAVLDAIDALHRKVIHMTNGVDFITCPTCDENTYGMWPCDTARLLHPAPEEDK